MVELEARRLCGKVALVTGAASGIGRATAELFVRHGARVAFADVEAAAVQAAAAACGDAAMAVALDVCDPDAWRAAVDAVAARWRQPLDVSVNCAGITDDAPLVDMTLERWRRVMAVNLDGTFLGTAAAMRAMAASGRGAIVNVSSLAGAKAYPGAAAYSASKAAVIHLTKVAALECAQAGHRVRVNCVVPGGVKTPMWAKAGQLEAIAATEQWNAPADAPALRRFATADEVAAVILFLASDEAAYVSGTAVAVDGGASA